MKTFRQLVASETPAGSSGAHDAISARLIQRAGFKALLHRRLSPGRWHGLSAFSDIGPCWRWERLGSGIREQLMASCDSWPVWSIADNGYGDVKNRRPRHQFLREARCPGRIPSKTTRCPRSSNADISARKAIVGHPEQMEAKHPRSGGESRQLRHFHHSQRTDAREVYGLDEALRRGRAVRPRRRGRTLH